MGLSAFGKKDRYLGTETEKKEIFTSVAAGNVEQIDVTASSGEIWEVVGLRLNVDANADATSGSHSMALIPTTDRRGNPYAIWAIESGFDNRISIQQNNVKSGNLAFFSGSEYQATVAVQGLLINDTTGIRFEYSNQTDATQESLRFIDVIVNKYEA